MVTLSLIALPALASNASTNHNGNNFGPGSCSTPRQSVKRTLFFTLITTDDHYVELELVVDYDDSTGDFNDLEDHDHGPLLSPDNDLLNDIVIHDARRPRRSRPRHCRQRHSVHALPCTTTTPVNALPIPRRLPSTTCQVPRRPRPRRPDATTTRPSTTLPSTTLPDDDECRTRRLRQRSSAAGFDVPVDDFYESTTTHDLRRRFTVTTVSSGCNPPTVPTTTPSLSNATIPSGAPETGAGGSAASTDSGVVLTASGLVLFAGLAGLVLALRRRRQA